MGNNEESASQKLPGVYIYTAPCTCHHILHRAPVIRNVFRGHVVIRYHLHTTLAVICIYKGWWQLYIDFWQCIYRFIIFASCHQFAALSKWFFYINLLYIDQYHPPPIKHIIIDFSKMKGKNVQYRKVYWNRCNYECIFIFSLEICWIWLELCRISA